MFSALSNFPSQQKLVTQPRLAVVITQSLLSWSWCIKTETMDQEQCDPERILIVCVASAVNNGCLWAIYALTEFIFLAQGQLLYPEHFHIQMETLCKSYHYKHNHQGRGCWWNSSETHPLYFVFSLIVFPFLDTISSVAMAWLGPVMTDGWLSQIEKSSCHWSQVTSANGDLKWSDYDLTRGCTVPVTTDTLLGKHFKI